MNNKMKRRFNEIIDSCVSQYISAVDDNDSFGIVNLTKLPDALIKAGAIFPDFKVEHIKQSKPQTPDKSNH